MEFVDLFDDVLLHIFSFLDPCDLHALQCLQVERICRLISVSVRRCSGRILMTGSGCFPELNRRALEDEDRLRIHSNWINGHFKESDCFSTPLKFVGRMAMDRHNFYVSNKGELRIYDRINEGYSFEDLKSSFGDAEEDPIICMMALKDECFFTGTYNGTCSFFRNSRLVVSHQKIHDAYKDITAMEFNKDLLISSNFREIKVFKVQENSLEMLSEVNWRGRCLKVDENCEKLVVGNFATDFHRDDGFIATLNPLSLYDIATMTKTDLPCNSQGILDMQWHSNGSTILAGHWNGDLRVYDLRTNTDVLTCPRSAAPKQNVSLAYDGGNGVLCGYRNSADICLFDLRKPAKHLRSFGEFMDTPTSYLVQILADSQTIFCVNNATVQMCDFSG